MMCHGIRPVQFKRALRTCLILMALMPVFLPAAVSSASTGLTLREAVVVDQDIVRLSDIADLSGAELSQRKILGAIVVAGSPQPGKTRFVGIDYVRIRLKQAGVDTASLFFNGPEDVRITRQSSVLPAGRIERAVETAIRNRMPWKNEDVTISGITFDDTIQLPTGKLTYRIVPNRNEDFLGRTILALHLFVDGEPVRRLWVNATIAVTSDVVTVVRPLGKNQHIEPADLSIERRDLAALPSDTVSRIEDALGNRDHADDLSEYRASVEYDFLSAVGQTRRHGQDCGQCRYHDHHRHRNGQAAGMQRRDGAGDEYRFQPYRHGSSHRAGCR